MELLRDWLWAPVAVAWGLGIARIAPLFTVFSNTVPFAVLMSFWALDMVLGSTLALGKWSETLHAILPDGTPTTIIRPRFWQWHRFRKGLFKFVLLFSVLWCCYGLRIGHIVCGWAIASAVEGYIVLALFAKVFIKIGIIIGDKNMEAAGEAIDGTAVYVLKRVDLKKLS